MRIESVKIFYQSYQRHKILGISRISGTMRAALVPVVTAWRSKISNKLMSCCSNQAALNSQSAKCKSCH